MMPYIISRDNTALLEIMMDDEAEDTSTTAGEALLIQPGRRLRSPKQDKELDYQHQMRPVYGGRCRRINDRRLPQIERQLFRRSQEAAVHTARYDEDAADELAGTLRGMKRQRFTIGRDRRRIRLKDAVNLQPEDKRSIPI